MEGQYFVYVIENSGGRRYIGYTTDLHRRLDDHNKGTVPRWTKSRGPWALVYYEVCATKREALQREKYLKTGVGRDWLKHTL